MSAELLADLARVKAVFQLRAISAVLGLPQGDRSPKGQDGEAGLVGDESAAAEGMRQNTPAKSRGI